MSVIINKIKNNTFLFFVILAYITLFVFMPEKGIASINNSLYYVKEMLIIMPVILILTSLIEAWVPKKTIENSLGENSGVKGLIFSFLLGSFSAGPIYAAFPICKMLMRKGASIANIVVILSAWAVIKIPMLVNESKFLGAKFMGVRWVLTIIAILAMAIITSKVVKKEDLPQEDIIEKEDEKLEADEKTCMGCGVCIKLAPNIFEFSNKKAIVNKEILRKDANNEIIIALDKCPVKAIKFIGRN